MTNNLVLIYVKGIVNSTSNKTVFCYRQEKAKDFRWLETIGADIALEEGFNNTWYIFKDGNYDYQHLYMHVSETKR